MDKKAMFDELLKWSQSLPLQPDEFTTREFREYLEETKRTSLSKSAISNRLVALVEAGKITKRHVIIDGRRQNAYKLTTK